MNDLKLRIKELAAKAEAVREFAVGDQILKLGFKAAKAKGVYRPEKLAMASQLHGPILSIALTKKQPVPAGVAAWNHPALWNQAKRNAAARQIREYRGVLQRANLAGGKPMREFARGDFAAPFLKKALQSIKGEHPPVWAASRHPVPFSTRGYEYYKDLIPTPNPIEEALTLGTVTRAIKKPSKPQIDLIGSPSIFSGQKRTNPIRKDVAKIIKEIRSNKTPSPLSDASYAQAGIKRPWGFSLGTDPEAAGRLMR